MPRHGAYDACDAALEGRTRLIGARPPPPPLLQPTSLVKLPLLSVLTVVPPAETT